MNKLRITTVSEVTVKFHPKVDKDEMVREFSEGIFQIDHWDDLVKFAAEQIAKNGAHWIEGVGRADPDYGQEFSKDLDYSDMIHFDLDVVDIDTDVCHE